MVWCLTFGQEQALSHFGGSVTWDCILPPGKKRCKIGFCCLQGYESNICLTWLSINILSCCKDYYDSAMAIFGVCISDFDNELIFAGSVKKGDNVCMRPYNQPEMELIIKIGKAKKKNVRIT